MSEAPALTPQTPMIRQYLEIKERYKDAILFYRIGDFYEMFFDDAVVASKALDIVLTSRNKNDENPIPLCGVPYHAVQGYLSRLIEQGFKVAICDQVEDPKNAKGVVRREVTRVVTPALLTEAEGLGAKEVSYLAAISPGKKIWGLALLDMASGDFRITELPQEQVMEELKAVSPKEVLVPKEWAGGPARGKDTETPKGPLGILPPVTPRQFLDPMAACEELYHQFGVTTLAGFECEGMPVAITAAGAILHYIKETQKRDRFPHITSLKKISRSESMMLTAEVQATLDLPRLFDFLDRTSTTMGSRALRALLTRPLTNRKIIEARLDAVEELANRPDLAQKIKNPLGSMNDVERIVGRISLETANPRDLVGLGHSLALATELIPLLSEGRAVLLKEISSGWDPHPAVREKIVRTLTEEGLIRDGFSTDLDDLRKISRDAKGYLAALEERERKRTGIGSLKVRFNKVFGYYIEVTTPNLPKVPADYIRKQTTTGGERFITPELKEFEDKILGAEEKIRALESEIFLSLRDGLRPQVESLRRQAGRLATLDVLTTLAEIAHQRGYVRPILTDGSGIDIKGGRHPVVEQSLTAGRFVGNDLLLDTAANRLLIVTGPNMAGKSTLIRQTGLLVVLAQIGSFVPAVSCRIGLVDRIFTRVGASDRLSEGQSTFMVEMSETAAILHQATDKSLILLDEIGRGTSTFDGISIAWAVAEYLHDKVGARTLFATHYHELTELEKTKPGIKNYNVAVRDEGGEITFLYKLVRGGMSASYGLHVAKLAGIPAPVLERASEVLEDLEKGKRAHQQKLF